MFVHYLLIAPNTKTNSLCVQTHLAKKLFLILNAWRLHLVGYCFAFFSATELIRIGLSVQGFCAWWIFRITKTRKKTYAKLLDLVCGDYSCGALVKISRYQMWKMPDHCCGFQGVNHLKREFCSEIILNGFTPIFNCGCNCWNFIVCMWLFTVYEENITCVCLRKKSMPLYLFIRYATFQKPIALCCRL